MKITNDVPGYTKKNAYRVWGNILRLSRDFDFGWLTGQVRTGLWWENAATQRARFDFDCPAMRRERLQSVAQPDLRRLPRLVRQDQVRRLSTAASPNITSIPAGTSISPSSKWNCIRSPDLTVTPGLQICELGAQRERAAGTEDGAGGALLRLLHHHPRLPFLMANYKLEPNWSVYAQYAQGIYIPDISSFEQATPCP